MILSVTEQATGGLIVGCKIHRAMDLQVIVRATHTPANTASRSSQNGLLVLEVFEHFLRHRF
ncbi:MAG: hypothetical protein ACKO9Q_31205, partial [Pirellula sp.]